MPATRFSCFAAAIVLPGFLTLAAVAARQASEQQGAIEGAVLRADSGKGIAGATVYLTLRSPTASLTATRTTTNADGGFSFPNLAPGAYTLWASADGFGQVRYGPQPRLNAPGMPITLAPLERFTNATIRLPLLGVIRYTPVVFGIG